MTEYNEGDLVEAVKGEEPRHHVFSYKTARSIKADCSNCDDGTESWGFDESSSRRVAAWIKKHETQL